MIKTAVIVVVTAGLSACSLATKKDLEQLRLDVAQDANQLSSRQEAIASRQARVSREIASLDAKLSKISQSAALTTQIALISTIGAERNDEAIGSLNLEIVKLAEENKKLGQQIAASDAALAHTLGEMNALAQRVK